MNNELFEALRLLEKENGISGELLIEKVKQGILKAVKKDYPECRNISIVISPETGKFEMKILKEIVDGEVLDPDNQITLDEAKTYSKRARVGEMCEIPLSPAKFGRVAASSAKQSIKHDIKEFEKERFLGVYEEKKNECVAATVQKIEPGTLNAIVTINKDEVYLPRTEQIPGEVLKPGDIIKVYIVNLVNLDRKPTIKISRTHKDLVKRLFELEVPEIYDGTVEVKSISREAGSRSKIAVWSKDPNVDAIGSCIGPKRSRITAIVDELKGEKIDIVSFSENDAEFIAKSLAPAEVVSVTLAEDGSRSCTAVVPNSQLSLAIGNKGQNAKLAARLTGYKIDIVPENPIGAEVQ